ncbi:molybdopterin-dependent oxidoreductase [Roseibium sp.]|uniref:molybdopterin-dependent oxidoreductase n=2 Tax=Roseibium sp. TaxID=1936156 RepID=UPI003D0DEEC4
MRQKLRNFLLVLFFISSGFPGSAQDLDSTVLTISGKIASGSPADFTIHMLEELPQERIETTTPWHDGKVSFVGVPLEKLMKHIGANGSEAAVTALNDYRSVIPLTDFETNHPILAYKYNGKYMSIRDKGPLFIIYPFDDHPDLKTELIYSRSVWQVRSIEIE